MTASRRTFRGRSPPTSAAPTAGRWDAPPAFTGRELRDRMLGIVGFRDIGRTACQGMLVLPLGRRPRGVLNPELFERPEFLDKWAETIGSDAPHAHRHAPSPPVEPARHA